jgi:predicted DNA-binding antitoxin AbrB/MazE fold protein
MMLMSQTIPAVFEDGVFRPLRRPKGLAEHHHVTLTVDVEEQVPALAEVSGTLSTEDAQELREIIDREFERVDPKEW